MKSKKPTPVRVLRRVFKKAGKVREAWREACWVFIRDQRGQIHRVPCPRP